MCTNAAPCSKNIFPSRFFENPPKTGKNALFTPFWPVFRKPRWKFKNSFSLRFSENRPKWGKKCLLPCFRGVFRKPHEIFGRLPLFLAESGRGHVRCSDLMIKKYVSANILFCGHDPYWDFGRLPLTKKKVWSRQHTFHQIARIFLICHYRCACFQVRPCRNRRVAIDRDKESFLSSFECYFCSCSHHNLRLIRNLHPCLMSMLISRFNFLFPLAFLVWPICPMLCFQHLRGSPSACPGRTGPNRTGPNRTGPNQTGPNREITFIFSRLRPRSCAL